MEKIEIEILTTAFQIKMYCSYWVIIYAVSEENEKLSYVAWYDFDIQELQDPCNNFEKLIISGKMIGWSEIPFLD